MIAKNALKTHDLFLRGTGTGTGIHGTFHSPTPDQLEVGGGKENGIEMCPHNGVVFI